LSGPKGLLCGMMPMPGTVVTEIDAIRQLTGAEALPITVNGIGSGAGTVVLLIEGSKDRVDQAWELTQAIKKKREPSLQDPPSPCDDCFLLKNPDLGVRCSTMRHLE